MGVIERFPGRAPWLLAAALGCASAVLAPAPTWAQATGKPRAASPAATAAAPAVKKKPTLRKKARPSGKARSAVKHSQSRAARRGKPVLSTRGPQARRAPPVAKAGRVAPPPMSPPVAWTPPPLGPERFYPNGIPELRPEFLHPVPGAPASVPALSAQAAAPRAPGAEPEWLP